jgi:hypothetical protein
MASIIGGRGVEPALAATATAFLIWPVFLVGTGEQGDLAAGQNRQFEGQ